MIEQTIAIDNADPQIIYGVNNANLRLLKALYPKLRIVARGNVFKVMGDEQATAKFADDIGRIARIANRYNKLTEEDLIDVVTGKDTFHSEDNVIVYNTSGHPITARTKNQKRLVDAYADNDLVFSIGPAGTGKTYTAIALAVRALKDREVRKIILSRPAVEAGEKLGFLPGDMKEKIDPYLQPLYDALEEMIAPARLPEMIEQDIIQIAPLAFMRGRTLNDAVVVLDEAQNTTSAQIKMFLTRMGHNTKMIVTGDRTQIDLPRSVRSGLTEAERILKGIKGIAFIEMDKSDIVRHPLVSRIVEAYDAEAAREAEKRKKREAEAGTTQWQPANDKTKN